MSLYILIESYARHGDKPFLYTVCEYLQRNGLGARPTGQTFEGNYDYLELDVLAETQAQKNTAIRVANELRHYDPASPPDGLAGINVGFVKLEPKKTRTDDVHGLSDRVLGETFPEFVMESAVLTQGSSRIIIYFP